MDRPTLISKVTIKLDEISQFGEGLIISSSNVNNKPIDKTIDEALGDANTEILITLPMHLLPITKLPIVLLSDVYVAGTTYGIGSEVSEGTVNYTSLTDNNVGNLPSTHTTNWVATPSNQPNVNITNNVATVRLDSDYLKLAYVNFPCWEKPVEETINQSHPKYKLQKNEFVRGGYSKPVVAITRDYTNRKFLECYTVEDDSTNKAGCEVLYVKKSNPEMIPDNLVSALTTLTAAKVLGTWGKTELKKLADEEYLRIVSLLLNT